jgi:hypothetical protein
VIQPTDPAQALTSEGASVRAGVRAIDHDHGVPDLPNLKPLRIDLSSRHPIDEGARAIATSDIDVPAYRHRRLESR